MQRIYSDQSTLTMSYHNLCRFLRFLGKEGLTEEEVNEFIELEIEHGNIEAKETAMMSDSLYLTPVVSLPLSSRAINCLIRALPSSQRPKEERTVGEVMRRIPRISNVPHCGDATAKEIISVFRDFGVDVTHWEEDVKNSHSKTSFVMSDPFPKLP